MTAIGRIEWKLMKFQNIRINIQKDDFVSAVITSPDKPNTNSETGLIFAHGAGNDMNHPLIVSVSEGLANSGFITMRFNFPYRERGKKAPDSQTVLVNTWLKAFDHLKNKSGYGISYVITVGKSMGGRVASQMVADGQMDVARLIFLGYPLHAPGRKEKLRGAHLSLIKVPMLFFAGTRDTLCDLAKLRGVLNKLNCQWGLEIIDGGDHSFKLRKSDYRTDNDVQLQVLQKCLSWLAE
ncbi:alpha/beta family hydrolase [Thermodesulfobacteriota bacterium]